MMANEKKQNFVCRRNGRVHLNRRGRGCGGGQLSRLLTVVECGSTGSDCNIFSMYVEHNLKMSLQEAGKKEW